MDKPYTIYGKENIEEGAHRQMANVMSLPVVTAGALMPDAHQGYGMPIGGVAQVKNALIPYAVGVDIGCRMHLTFFPTITEASARAMSARLKDAIVNATHFGPALPDAPNPHWRAKHFVDCHAAEWETLNRYFGDNALKDRAWRQFGTSGGGNHFVEWGFLEFGPSDTMLSSLRYGLGGSYGQQDNRVLALLSHSGSRSLGYAVANKFTEVAAKVNPLDGELKELSWLDDNTQEGQDYYSLMNLAGKFSQENHEIIHAAVKTAAGLQDTHCSSISNHHNFAWKSLQGSGRIYTHRKGATPAGSGTLGVIPGSMATPGYVVRGKGSVESIDSASHGAGRAMSRSKALKTISLEDRTKFLADAGVELISAGLDESPQAYKDIHKVMSYQADLVDIVAKFDPWIVRMGGKVADEGD